MKIKQRFFQGPTVGRYIVKNPKNEAFEEYFDDNNHILAERFHRKIKAETNWFENIITHSPTIGTFYEDLLRNTLYEFAPRNNKIGTGFVYDSEMQAHSKQIDILTYDDSDRCVLYRNGDFVIVYPGSVLSVTEVKKTIGTSNLREVIHSTFFNSLGSYSNEVSGIQRINIFAYSKKCKITTLCKVLVSSLEKCIDELKIENNGGVFLTTRCALPFIYFLDEDYYIETLLKHNEGINYELKVRLHKTSKSAGSLGMFLTNTLIENNNKKTSFESNLLSSKVRKLPKEFQVNGNLPLVRKVSYKKVIKHYNFKEKELEKIKHNGFKPLSIIIPITINLNEYKNYKELFKLPGVMIECFNEETNAIRMLDGRLMAAAHLA